MHSEMHQEKNGEPKTLKESRSRPCRVKKEMEDRRARIGAGRAASRERWKIGVHESEPAAPHQKKNGKEEIAQESEQYLPE